MKLNTQSDTAVNKADEYNERTLVVPASFHDEIESLPWSLETLRSVRERTLYRVFHQFRKSECRFSLWRHPATRRVLRYLITFVIGMAVLSFTMQQIA